MKLRSLLIVVLSAVALAALAVSSAVGKGTLTVDPDPVARGSTFTLVACGFPVPTSVSFEVNGPRKSGIHYFTAGEPLTDESGCVSDEWTAWWGVAGDYQITSWYRDSKGSTHKVAVVKFTVT